MNRHHPNGFPAIFDRNISSVTSNRQPTPPCPHSIHMPLPSLLGRPVPHGVKPAHLRPGLLITLILATSSAMALPDDRKQPIQLEANRGQLDQRSGISLYEGHVVIQQGSMRMDADIAKIHIKNGRLQKMEATGKPVRLRYKPTVDKPEIRGTSPKVDYNVDRAKIVMSGGARLVQGGDVFTGDRIEYDLKADRVKARGAGSNGRIQFTIQPQSKTVPSRKR
ncbi:MAG: lipopolysaccharide transport periplasmic protein LptA [Candidatus Contendobacter odensis]|uniref:Lipopolysaccharide export system protein LptA n=1 Tax=Candidatus Contendibacter odensensis TaxID=1400860 RepID=A0A2G6PG38_9GAMM|nr:MAG: lipopolysaccharide transport periplasmic protein LptA [Candidatus Contendobacter odensis]